MCVPPWGFAGAGLDRPLKARAALSGSKQPLYWFVL